ncbi:hypothetical protein [Aquabacterium sp.]|uniref:hypothetical protein n=1 Tax=Aquabacterium sp. TaxID=1872578 RepID=UPI0025BFE7C1|nr:hypothetical protein [Aquabacterium sp.]
MTNTKRKKREQWHSTLFFYMLMMTALPSLAHLQLSTKWDSRYRIDGSRIPDSDHELPKLEQVGMAAVKARTATPADTNFALRELSFKLSIDQTKFYMQPAKYMPQTRPGEVCTSVGKVTAYQCMEGQRETQACHIGFFDAQFHEVGWHTIRINESVPIFCNSIPAVGVYDATQNAMLVTVQYFAIDHKPAAKPSEIGSGWKRMTVLLRLTSNNGKITVEQDDRCLGNPNQVDAVPDAKRALRRCNASLPSSAVH